MSNPKLVVNSKVPPHSSSPVTADLLPKLEARNARNLSEGVNAKVKRGGERVKI